MGFVLNWPFGASKDTLGKIMNLFICKDWFNHGMKLIYCYKKFGHKYIYLRIQLILISLLAKI